ncbi:MAG TPA: hypothetical protein PLG59_07320 [bacterium]|nr:hypothetical protein [bacterium]HQO34453.1 hypothetical protein [bacterium]HQP97927.1 hypothetical protein [bacterium]
MTTQCCKCHKVKNGNKWLKPDARTLRRELVTHTYCPSCFDETLYEIRFVSQHEGKAVAIA